MNYCVNKTESELSQMWNSRNVKKLFLLLLITMWDLKGIFSFEANILRIQEVSTLGVQVIS